jgi:putative FmdB family regulatory protein
MPVYDFVCDGCGEEKKDILTRSWDEEVKCEKCGEVMRKKVGVFFPDIFPADGIFLRNVSAEGKRFMSKKEMRKYAKDNDLELGAL